MRHRIKALLDRAAYQNDYELLNNPYKKSQDYFIMQALFVTGFTTFTGGVFLSGFAVYLGASDSQVGYIGLIPSICGVFVIFSGLLLERFHSRKKLVIILNIISRSLMCMLVLLPLLVGEQYQLALVILFLVIVHTIQAFNGVAVNSWFIRVVPENIRGRYFAVRQTFALALSAVLPLVAGTIMDSVSSKYTGFLILYGIGALMIVGETFSYVKIEEPAIKNMGRENLRLGDIFRVPLKNGRFAYYIAVLFFLYISLYISCNFTQVYMLRYLKLSYTFITAVGVFFAIIQIFFYRMWGKISDSRGHGMVMKASIWFYAAELSFWAIMNDRSVYVLMPVAYIASAVANSGFAVGSFNFRYTIIPEKGRTLYDGFFTTVVGAALIISPVIGGMIKSCLANIQFVHDIKFGDFRLLYALSVFCIVLLQVFDIVIQRRKGRHGANALKLIPLQKAKSKY